MNTSTDTPTEAWRVGIADLILCLHQWQAAPNGAPSTLAWNRLQQVINALADAPDGYADAFYELSALMGMSAQSLSPATVWKEQMLPRLRAALAATKAEQLEACTDAYPQAAIDAQAPPSVPSPAVKESLTVAAPDDTPLETGEGDAR